MPVVTRSMKTISNEEYEIAEILCELKNAYTRSTSKYLSSDNEVEEDEDEEDLSSDDEDEEYVPPSRSRKFVVRETDDDEEYVPDQEDFAENVIRLGCSYFSLGIPLDRDFFRVCKKVVKGDYSPAFTRWALKIQPVRAVGGY